MTRVGLVAASLLLALTLAQPSARQEARRLALELDDYAALPITADNTNTNTRAQLARVNFLRDEPGGRRFFVNDLNGPLYILDKQTRKLHRLPGFQWPSWPARTLPEVYLRAQLRHGPHQLRLRPRLRAQRRLLYAAHGGPERCGLGRAEDRRRSEASISPATPPHRRCRRQRSREGSTARSC